MKILDLDDIIERPVHFMLLQRERMLKPIRLNEFLGIADAFSRIESEPSSNAVDLARQYFNIFSSCIEPIELSDVLKMTQAQCAALLSIITRRMQGESVESLADSNEEVDLKKKHQNQLS
jgi:hypothetical protein